MSRFLGSKVTLVVLLVSILLLVVGISVAAGAGSGGQSAAQDGETPSVQAVPVMVVVEGCSGAAEFDILGAGWNDGEVVLLTVTTETQRQFVGAGFPGGSGAFIDDVSVRVEECGALTVRGLGKDQRTVSTPVVIVESK